MKTFKQPKDPNYQDIWYNIDDLDNAYSRGFKAGLKKGKNIKFTLRLVKYTED